MNASFKNKSILITGGTGSFGQKFTEVILRKFKNIKNVKVIDKLVGRKNSNNILFYELGKPTGMNSIIKTKLKSFIQKKQQVSLDRFIKKIN